MLHVLLTNLPVLSVPVPLFGLEEPLFGRGSKSVRPSLSQVAGLATVACAPRFPRLRVLFFAFRACFHFTTETQEAAAAGVAEERGRVTDTLSRDARHKTTSNAGSAHVEVRRVVKKLTARLGCQVLVVLFC